MGLLWDYFKDTLRLPFLAAPGPLAMLAEGGAEALDESRDMPITIRDQFFADRCEIAYMGAFARSRGIFPAPLEPEESYMARVRLAFLWHKRGGRASAMRRVLIDYFGFADITIVNMRSEDPTRWAEFRVICDLIGDQPMFTLDQVTWAINEIKPARSKLLEVIFVASVIGNIPCWSFGLFSAGVTTVWPLVEENYGGPVGLTDEDDGAGLTDEDDEAGLTTT